MRFNRLAAVLLLSLGVTLSSQGQSLRSTDLEVVSGTIATGSATLVGPIKGFCRLDLNWMSTAGGVVDATVNYILGGRPSGKLVGADFCPNLVTPPTNNYSATISKDFGGTSTPLIAAVNLSSATRSSFGVTLKTPGNVHVPAFFFDPLSIYIEGAGSQKKGKIRLYFERY